jgi:hypothetical protein
MFTNSFFDFFGLIPNLRECSLREISVMPEDNWQLDNWLSPSSVTRFPAPGGLGDNLDYVPELDDTGGDSSAHSSYNTSATSSAERNFVYH